VRVGSVLTCEILESEGLCKDEPSDHSFIRGMAELVIKVANQQIIGVK